MWFVLEMSFQALNQAGIPTAQKGRPPSIEPPVAAGLDALAGQVLDLLAYLRLVIDPHHDPCTRPKHFIQKPK